MSVRESLKAARECLSTDPRQAIKFCKAALQQDKGSYEAYVFVGKASFQLQEYSQSELAYTKAVENNRDGVPAWMGTAELHEATGDSEKLRPALEKLVELSVDSSNPAAQKKRPELLVRMARCYDALGVEGRAEGTWRLVLEEGAEGEARREALQGLVCSLLDEEDAVAKELLDRRIQAAASKGDGTGDADAIRRRVLAKMAAARDGVLEEALRATVENTPSSPRYVRAHRAWVLRSLRRAEAARRGDDVRAWGRAVGEAWAECVAMASRQPVASLPFEEALGLVDQLEAAEEAVPDSGAMGMDSIKALAAGLGRRLVHGWPHSPRALLFAAQSTWLSLDVKPVAARRAKPLLIRGLKHHEGDVRSWLLLSEVQLELDASASALECTKRGLRAVRAARSEAGLAISPLLFRSVEAQLKIAAGAALRAAGRLDEAEAALEALLRCAREGLDVRERVRALRELGKVAAARGDPLQARARYAEVLREAPGDHWTAAEVAWLAHEEGDLERSRAELQAALELAEASGAGAADRAAYCLRLGRVCWELGGDLRRDRGHAHAQWLAAAAVEGPCQAEAFSWLGRFYREVAKDPPRARRCFQRSLALDPLQAEAGEGMGDLLRAAGQGALEDALYREMSGRSAAAYWAHRRMAAADVRAGRLEDALAGFQRALRGEPGRASLWEGLADCYQRLGRVTAALRSYTRAVELDPSRAYSHSQAGALHAQLYAFHLAVPCYARALELDPAYPPALMGAGQALLTSARGHAATGALGAASEELAAAAAHASRCAREHGGLSAAWKLLGDALLAHHSVPPASAAAGTTDPPGDSKGAATCVAGVAGEAGTRDLLSRIGAVRGSQRAYARALHLCPGEAGRWGDLAAAHYHEAALRRQHAGVPAARAALVPGRSEGLRAMAERLMKGALRAAPGREELWLVMGLVAGDAGVRECALARALELNPRCAPAWAVLGRLYSDAGEGALAAKALEQARSADPTLAPAWESMALLASRGAGGREGLGEAAQLFEHAVMLGAGPQAQLGLAECSAALSIPGGELSSPAAHGGVYAAARKAAAQQPLNAAALNAVGLASEARGLLPEATAAFSAARELLLAAGEQQQADGAGDGSAIGGIVSFGDVYGGGGRGWLALRHCVEMNLARALALSGDPANAEATFSGPLDAGGSFLRGGAAAWHARGVALWGAGDPMGADRALRRALELADHDDAEAGAAPLGSPAGPSDIHCRVLAALCALMCRTGRAREALELFLVAPDVVRRALGGTEDASPLPSRAPYRHRGAATGPAAPPGGVWTMLLAAAVAEQDDVLQSDVLSRMRGEDSGDAAREAAALALEAEGALLGRQYRKALSLLSRAVRASPGCAEHRTSLARVSLLAAAPGSAQDIAAMCLASEASHPAGCPRGGATGSDVGAELLALAGAALLVCAPGATIGCAVERALCKWVARAPSCLESRYWLALVAAHRAAAAPSSHGARRAYLLCEGALLLSDGFPAGPDVTSARVRLSVCLSECALRGGGASTSDALRWAQAASGEPGAAGIDRGLSSLQLARVRAAGGDARGALRGYGSAAATLGTPGLWVLLEQAQVQAATGDLQGALEVLAESEQLAAVPDIGTGKPAPAQAAAAIVRARVLMQAEGGADAARASLPAGSASASTPELVLNGALWLDAARGPAGDGRTSPANQARKILSKACAADRRLSGPRRASPSAVALLASAESSSSSRGAESRAASLAVAARASWGHIGTPCPPGLYNQLSRAGADSSADRKAVHSNPAHAALWSALGHVC